MFSSVKANKVVSYATWEVDIECTFPKEEWKQINVAVTKGALSVNVQESWCKLQSRWYKTLCLLHKIFPTTSDACWHCSQAGSNLLHIWWTYTNISETVY